MKEVKLTKENIEEVIGRQVDQIASQEELKALEEWRQKSKDNEDYYQQIIQVNQWYLNSTSTDINVSKAWNKVSKRINAKDSGKKQSKSMHLWSYLGYAASFLVVFGSVLYWWNSNEKTVYPKQYATNHTPMDYALGDGSIIHLTANSALSKLEDSERSFRFSGAAKFEVTHDDDRPFMVHMNDIIVKDLGTVFDIDAQPNNDTVFVKVMEGIVQFYTKDQEGIRLNHGEEGMYIKSKDRFFKRSIDSSNPFLSMLFKNSTFGEVVDHLAYSFRKDVLLENENIRNCNITVDFEKAPFSVVKEIIEETLSVTIEKKDGTLRIDGKGCN